MPNERELTVEGSDIVRVAKALASETRLRILRLLSVREADISELAKAIGQSEANTSSQIKILENAGLVEAVYRPGRHGVKKVCRLAKSVVRLKIA